MLAASGLSRSSKSSFPPCNTGAAVEIHFAQSDYPSAKSLRQTPRSAALQLQSKP